MKKYFLSTFLCSSFLLNAQVGINTTDPKTTMDVSAKRDNSGNILENTQILGLQAPRLTRAELTANTATYGTDQKGALVYITDITGGNTTGQRINITSIGYYYFDGSVWQKLSGSGSGSVNQNIYTTDGTLNRDRIVNQSTNSLTFTSTATSGTNQFSVDGSTFSVNTVDNRIGINTTTPSNSLDINGDLKVRTVQFSNNSSDIPLVIDNNGVIKKDLKNIPSNYFRGYSTSNFTSGGSTTTVYTITGIAPIGNNSNYNTATGIFSVGNTGIYKITITATLMGTASNMITGLKNTTTNQWITRSTYDASSYAGAGRAFTTVNVVQLKEGDKIAFGLGPSTTILAIPAGSTGSGIGSFYEIEFLSEGTL